MQITFSTEKMKKIFVSQKELRREFGDEQAKIIMKRMTALEAAENLSYFTPKQKPERCHELTGNRKGILAIDLKHPYRLLFMPDFEQPPALPDGGLDWARVDSIKILKVENYHE